MTLNFDTQDRELFRRLWTLSYPSIIASVLQVVYDIVDLAYVGQISKEAMSGVTLFTVISGIFSVLNEVAGASSVAMIAQSYGRGDEERTRKISEQTISFKIVLAILSGFFLYTLLDPLLSLYTQDPAVIEAANQYGRIRVFFLPVAFSSYSINTIFRCTGDAKSPMRFMMASTLVNLILDPIFMFETLPFGLKGFGMGVYGAGLATVIAQTVSFLYGFIILVSGRHGRTIELRGLLSLDREIDIDLLRIGLPAGLQLFIRMAFNAVVMLFITPFGATAVAVAGISSKFVQFGFVPVFGFHMAGSTLIGHALGRNDENEAERLTELASLVIFLVVSLLSVPGMIYPPLYLRIFSQDAAVLAAGVPMVRWIGLAMLFMSFSMGWRIAFSGSGFNKPILIADLLSRWGVQLPMMFVMTRIFQVSLSALWVSYVFTELAGMLVIHYYYVHGGWRSMRV